MTQAGHRHNLHHFDALLVQPNDLLVVGSYGDNPHVHWTLEKPRDQSDRAFEALLRNIAQTTTGIGEQLDIQQYYGSKWLSYMVDHGFDGWQPGLTFAARCPKH